MLDNIIFFGSILLFLSIYLSKVSHKLGIPTLIIFITIGIIFGSDGLNLINFSNVNIAQSIGIISLTIILFSGGLDTDINRIRPVMKEGTILSSIGVILTAFFMGFFIHKITKLSIWEGLLLGSIVSSTDAAAVFSVLRTKNFILKKGLGPILELESGSNDPVAYLLTIIFTSIILKGSPETGDILLLLSQQIIIGVAVGFFWGKFMVFVFNNINLNITGLYPVLGLALAFLCFSITSFSNGNGFLAIYIAAVTFGNSDFIFKKNVKKFFDGMSWLMQLVVFLTLGLLVSPKELIPLIGEGLIIAIFLMFGARPLTVFITMFFYKERDIKEKFLLSWVGLRGAASIVFAMYPMTKGIEISHYIFNLVFFIAITTVLIQGITLNFVAKKLNLVEMDTGDLSKHPLALDEKFTNEILEITVLENSKLSNRRIKEISFPKNSLIIRIERKGRYISPNGDTTLLAEDKLLITVEDLNIYNEIREKFCVR